MAISLSVGIHNATPSNISAIPLQKTKALWFGKYLGIIRIYIFGFTKCITPAKTYMAAMIYNPMGSFILVGFVGDANTIVEQILV